MFGRCVPVATQPAAVQEKPPTLNSKTIARTLEKEKEEEEELTRDKFNQMLALERPFELHIRDTQVLVLTSAVTVELACWPARAHGVYSVDCRL